jgi:hexokinase
LIEEDPFENLSETQEVIENRLGIAASRSELEFCHRFAELIGTRAARLSACGIAAICVKKKIDSCHLGTGGSVYAKYPHLKQRVGKTLKDILD